MPSLIDLRRRIRAVKNTQQITKAMKMVAASKLRRAQERLMSARPYAVQMQRVLGSVASRVDSSIHPLLSSREVTPESRTLVIIVTATYHLGYPQYRQDGISRPETGNVLISIPTFATANPVGSIVAHVSQHVAAVTHSYESKIFNPPITKP